MKKRLLICLGGICLSTTTITSCGLENKSKSDFSLKTVVVDPETKQVNIEMNVEDLFHQQKFDYETWKNVGINLKRNNITDERNGQLIWNGDLTTYSYIVADAIGSYNHSNLMSRLIGAYVVSESMKKHQPIKKFKDFFYPGPNPFFYYDFYFKIKSGDEICKLDFIHSIKEKSHSIIVDSPSYLKGSELDYSNCIIFDPKNNGQYALKNTLIIENLKNFEGPKTFSETESKITYENTKDIYIWDGATIDQKYIDEGITWIQPAS